MNLDHLRIRPLTREEFDIAVEWAANEGWNPGLHDADVFWKTDPEGYVGAELDGELVATGSIVSYDGNYGFTGFFIVRPDLRGQGIGTKLWYYRRDHLKSRLSPDASIGMDGVFDMQDWYAKGGFTFSHRNLRMEGIGKAAPGQPQVISLSEVPFEKVLAYDTTHFGCSRGNFLKEWISMPDAFAAGFVEDENLKGYGMIRSCREGHKIGPLFADNPAVAEFLFDQLSARVEGEPLWLDIPENNPDAIALANRHGMSEVFGCARMYFGNTPDLPWQNIYGITTFELG